ncbi:sigma-54 dependent transcriptional regulator [bacterium]|nr:sigma-54 dependent transcriptional regulator [bacterium]
MPVAAPKRTARVCIIDDEEPFVSVLREELAREGFKVASALSGGDGMKLLEDEPFDVCILDINMPGLNGLEVLGRAAEQAIPAEFIVLTACTSLQTAVEAIRLGAYEFLAKPCSLEKMAFLIRKAFEKRLLRQDSLVLKRMSEGRGRIITKSRSVAKLLSEAGKVARSDAPVLILGESGTGKELFAEFIHENSSRSAAPFIIFNAATIQHGLFESELFGYEKGAFTGALASKAGLLELADGGTLFLDEIGEVPYEMQAKLLRVIEKGTFYKVGGTKELHVDLRVVTATNRDLPGMAAGGRFREDLYYRLSSVVMELPPLRERKEDIPILAEDLLSRLPAGYRKKISPAALDVLLMHSWPGNIRELQNALNRAAIISDSDEIGPSDLHIEPVHASNADRPGAAPVLVSLAEMEKEHIGKVLGHTKGNRKKAAEILGIDVKTLYRKIRLYGL